jgi:hypothetical protein
MTIEISPRLAGALAAAGSVPIASAASAAWLHFVPASRELEVAAAAAIGCGMLAAGIAVRRDRTSTVTVIGRSQDYEARLDGDDVPSATGASADEALGKLVRSRGEALGIAVTLAGKQA